MDIYIISNTEVCKCPSKTHIIINKLQIGKLMEMKDRMAYEAVTLKVVEIKARGVLCVSVFQEGADAIENEDGEW